MQLRTISPWVNPNPIAYWGSISIVSVPFSEPPELKWARDEAEAIPVHPKYASTRADEPCREFSGRVRWTARFWGRWGQMRNKANEMEILDSVLQLNVLEGGHILILGGLRGMIWVIRNVFDLVGALKFEGRKRTSIPSLLRLHGQVMTWVWCQKP
jgi:hypothetical protein